MAKIGKSWSDCHLLIAIEKTCRDNNVHTSWETLRKQPSTHQVVTLRIPSVDKTETKIRKSSTPEPLHREIYKTLDIPEQIIKPVKIQGAIIGTECIVSERASQ